jgi:hypothetical protein
VAPLAGQPVKDEKKVDLHYGHLLNDSDDALFGVMNRFDAERLDARLTQDASEETG